MHPLHLLAIGYIAGLLLAGGASFAPAEAGAVSLIAAALALPFAVFIALGRRTRGETRIAAASLLLLAGLIASFAVPALHRHRTPAHHLLRHVPYGRMNVTGRLSRPVERTGGASRRPRVYLEVERAFIRGAEVPMTGVARVTLASRLKEIPRVGDRLLIRRARLKPPSRFKNPGAFDYREFLRLRGVHAVGYSSIRNLHLLEAGEERGWRRRLFRFRENMSAHIHAAYSGGAAGLIEAMTIGPRGDLDREIRDAFRRSGAAHLLAISGLHVGFIAAFFFFSLRGLLRRLPPRLFPLDPIPLTPSKLASLGVIPLVILFTLLSGARISTVRAAIMIVAYLLTRLLERPKTALHSVTLAALLILLVEPGFIWDAGFQLSFVAVSAIVLAAERLPRPDPRWRFWEKKRWAARARQLAVIQVVVTAAVTPLTALHFQEAHPIGLLVNFLLIPAASLLVPLAFAASAAAAVLPAGWDALLTPLTWLTGALAQFLILVSTHSARIPWAALIAPKPNVWLIAAIFSLLALALRLRRTRWRGISWAGLCCLTLFLLLPGAGERASRPGRATLLLPDAAGVDAFFLRLPDGKGLAVDASGSRAGGFSVWGSVLAPLMRGESETNWSVMLSRSRYPKDRLAANEFAAGVSVRSLHRIGDLLASAPPRYRFASLRNSARVVWSMAGGGTRITLRFWRKGAMGFEVENPHSRWLLMLPSKYPAFDARWFAGKKYDLARLPEGLLRQARVLDWLEAQKPDVVLAAPQRVGWLRPDVWRETSRRQRKLGVYRPWRGGMLRVSAGDGAREARLSVERFRAAEAWPRSGAARWVAFRRRIPREFSWNRGSGRRAGDVR